LESSSQRYPCGVDEVVTAESGWHGYNPEKEKSFEALKPVPRIILKIG